MKKTSNVHKTTKELLNEAIEIAKKQIPTLIHSLENLKKALRPSLNPNLYFFPQASLRRQNAKDIALETLSFIKLLANDPSKNNQNYLIYIPAFKKCCKQYLPQTNQQHLNTSYENAIGNLIGVTIVWLASSRIISGILAWMFTAPVLPLFMAGIAITAICMFSLLAGIQQRNYDNNLINSIGTFAHKELHDKLDTDTDVTDGMMMTTSL